MEKVSLIIWLGNVMEVVFCDLMVQKVEVGRGGEEILVSALLGKEVTK